MARDVNGFKTAVFKAVESFKKSKPRIVRLISHLDADGLCSASILVKLFKTLRIAYNLTIVQQVDKFFIQELLKEHYKVYIFSDLGSNLRVVSALAKHNKLVIVLDHHEVDDKSLLNLENLVVVNSKLYGLDEELSGAGVCHYFAKAFNKNIKTAHLAIIGAIGDLQDKPRFQGLNLEILQEAVSQGLISVEKGLNLFWLESKPLVKVLQHSKDIVIPGVTGSESSVVQFLQSIGVNPVNSNGWRFFKDLTAAEKDRFTTAVLMAANKQSSDYSDLIIEKYKIVGRNSVFSDAREFATVVNACGRLNKPLIGIAACLGNSKAEKQAEGLLLAYKRELLNALNFLNNALKKSSEHVFKNDKFIAFRAGSNIEPTIIGTVTSMLASDTVGAKYWFVMGLADNIDGTVKVSVRVGKSLRSKPLQGLNVRSLLQIPIEAVNGELGGHKLAAGAVIPKDKELEFIRHCLQVFGSFQPEEFVE